MIVRKRTKLIPKTSKVLGSFRDPEGHVFVTSERVFRGISNLAAHRVRGLIRSNFYKVRAGVHIVETNEISPQEVVAAGVSAEDVESYEMWIEHQRIPLITYPYEWSFESLKEAACLTLTLLIDGLKNGYMLKDASTFNVQFINCKPIFIDFLSFVEYKENSPFLGYKQFCEQFFAPLCLTAFSGIDFNTWFRGRLDGLNLIDVSAALPSSTYVRPQVLMHIHMHARAMRKVDSASTKQRIKREHTVRREHLIALAENMMRFISRLERKQSSYWQQYSVSNSYSEVSQIDRSTIVSEFVQKHKLAKILDLGCNTGEFSKVATDAGATQVIGIDFDCGAIDIAVKNALGKSLPMQFLYYDVTNPSPNSGWKNEERLTFERRLGQLDGVFCFALIHHVVISKNIPIDEFLDWVCSFARRGLIEFVPKSDPMVSELLLNREDIFPNYNREYFEQILNTYCKHVIVHTMRSTERVVLEFER